VIPEAQKDSQAISISVFSHFWDLRMQKLLARLNFTNVLRKAFTLADPKIVKKDSQVVNHFYASCA